MSSSSKVPFPGMFPLYLSCLQGGIPEFLILLLLVIYNTFSMSWGRIFFEIFPCSDDS